ncbi:MAG: hypothetical protein ACR2H2_19885 [Solirubrobacteraceae bacterium]
MTSIALAVIVANPRTVWLTVALLELGYAGVIFSGHSPAALARSDQLDGVVGGLLGYPFVALVLLGLTRLFARFLANVEHRCASSLGALPPASPATTFSSAPVSATAGAGGRASIRLRVAYGDPTQVGSGGRPGPLSGHRRHPAGRGGRHRHELVDRARPGSCAWLA